MAQARPFTFRRLIASTATSSLGDGLTRSLIPLFATAVSASPAAVGIVQTAARLPWLLVSLPAGYLVDTRGYRWVARIALVTKLVGAAALVAATFAHSLPGIVVAAFVVVAGEVAFDTGVHGSLIRLLRPAERTRGNSSLYSWQAIDGQFIGPGIGGELYALLGSASPTVSGVLHAIALVILGIRVGDHATTAPLESITVRSSLRLLVSGFVPLFANRGLRWTTLIGTISMFAYGLWGAVFVLYVTGSDHLRQAPIVFGLLTACPAIGAIAVGIVAARIVARLTAFAGVAAFAIGQLGLFIPPLVGATVIPVAIGLIIYGGGLSLWNSGVLAYRQAYVPNDLYGRATAAYRVSSWGASPIGAIVGAVLSGTVGIQWCFLAGAALVAVQALMACFSWSLTDFRGTE